LVKTAEFNNLLLEEFKKNAKTCGFFGFEIPKKVHVSLEAFSVENNILTPTFKMKRYEGKKFYIKEIREMYGGAKLQGDE